MAALAVAVAFGLSLPLAASWTDKFELIAVVAVAGALPAVFSYLVLAGGAVRFVREKRGGVWRWMVLALGVTFPLVAGYGAVVPFPTGSRRWGIWLVAGTLALSAVWTAYLRLRRPAALSAAASYALPA